MRIPVLPLAPGIILLVASFTMLPHATTAQAPAMGVRPDSPVAVPLQSKAAPDGMSDGAAPALSARAAAVTTALAALTEHVGALSDPDALRMAFQAYYNFRAAHPERVRKPYLYFVDYGLDSRTPRGYVFDMERLELVDGPFTVAHGRGSSSGRYGVPTRFSNSSGSATSSLGLYVTEQRYGFTGHTRGRPYASIGMRLDGVSGPFNSAAYARGVVVHGAPYVTASGSGRSEGCPAMEPSRARRLIPMLAEGSLVFLYSPNDRGWIENDPWATASVADAPVAP